MSADDFQTQYASVMEGMLKSAVAETTRLFQTMVDELRAEISRIKTENEALRSRCNQFEKAVGPAAASGRQTDRLPGRSSDKRDSAVQCDLVPFRLMLVEQCQPSRHSSLQNQDQQSGYEGVEFSLQDHNYATYEEGNSQMALIFIKQESVVKQAEAEATVVDGQVFSDRPGSFSNQRCLTRKIPLPQRPEETTGTLELCCLKMDGSLQGAPNHSTDLQQSLVISLTAKKDDMEEESSEIRTHGELATPEKHPSLVSQHQMQVEPLGLELPAVVIQQCPETSANKQTDASVQCANVQSPEDHVAPSTPLSKGQACDDLLNGDAEARPQPDWLAPRRRGHPPREQPALPQPLPSVRVKEVSPAVDIVTISSSETPQVAPAQPKPPPSIIGALEVKSPQASDQPRERCTFVPLRDAMLLVEAMNQSSEENRFSAPQRMAAPHQTPRASCVGTLPTAESQMLPIPVQTCKAPGHQPRPELPSTIEKPGAVPQTTDATPTNEAQAHVGVVSPKQQHTLTALSDASSSVQLLQQHRSHPLTTSPAPSTQANAVPHKIIVVPRSVSSLKPLKVTAQSPDQLPVVSAAVSTKGTGPDLPAAGPPLRAPPLSTVPQKTLCVTSRKPLPVVTSQSPSTNPQSAALTDRPSKVSLVVSRKHQSQTVVQTKKESVKSDGQVTVEEMTIPEDIQPAAAERATTLFQMKDNTLDSVVTLNAPSDTCSSLNVPPSVSPVLLPTFDKKLSAVVRLTRLPFPVSTKESFLVSKLPANEPSGPQSTLIAGTIQEKVSCVVISTQPPVTPESSTGLRHRLKETSAGINASQWSEEPNDTQKKASLSFENDILKASPGDEYVLPLAPVNTTEPSGVSGTPGEPTSNLDKDMIGAAGQDCPSSAEVPVKVKQPAGLVPLTSTSPKDQCDPHLQMTKTQFLAQLAVSPVVQDIKKASSSDARSSCAESSTSDNGFQNKSILAQLRSHLKAHFQARRADTNPEPHTETHTVSSKRPRLETHGPNDENTSNELISVNQKHPGAAEVVTPRGKTTMEPSLISQTRSGLCLDSVKAKAAVHPRRSKSACGSTPVATRKTSSGQDGVGSKNKKCTSMTVSPNKTSSKKTKPTSVSPNSTRDECSPNCTKASINPNDTNTTSTRPVQASSSGHGPSPKQTRSACVSPRASGKNGRGPKKSPNEVTPVSTRRCSFTKNTSSTRPTEGESDSFSPQRNGRTTDGASTKNTRRETGSSSVRWPKLAKDGVSPRKSNPAKNHRFIQDGTDPKKTLKVLNSQKSVKAVKGKTLAKVINSTQSNLRNGAKRSLSETRAACRPVKTCSAKGVWTPPRIPASRTAPAGGQRSSIPPAKKEARSQNHTLVYPPSVSLHPIPVKAPPIVSPLQPLSVIGRHLLKNQCGECGCVLGSSSALESHVGLHAGLRPFSCTLCGKHFSDSKGLKRHGRVHRNGRIHICQQCGKGFVYSFGLTKHIQMVHSRIKPFVCQICNKGCFTKQDVEAHIRSHTGEKPFHCNLCDKKFTRRIELNVHLRWHNGEKRHWCPYCGKGFLDFNNLKRHKYIHTGEKPHSCPHCVKNFTQSGHLKKHLKNVHKVQ